MNRRALPAALRNVVWNEYIGAKSGEGICFCCGSEPILRSNYECGHVISKNKGGNDKLQNLRPVCGLCNQSMGTKNMIDFAEECGFSCKLDFVGEIKNESQKTAGSTENKATDDDHEPGMSMPVASIVVTKDMGDKKLDRSSSHQSPLSSKSNSQPPSSKSNPRPSSSKSRLSLTGLQLFDHAKSQFSSRARLILNEMHDAEIQLLLTHIIDVVLDGSDKRQWCLDMLNELTAENELVPDPHDPKNKYRCRMCNVSITKKYAAEHLQTSKHQSVRCGLNLADQ